MPKICPHCKQILTKNLPKFYVIQASVHTWYIDKDFSDKTDHQVYWDDGFDDKRFFDTLKEAIKFSKKIIENGGRINILRLIRGKYHYGKTYIFPDGTLAWEPIDIKEYINSIPDPIEEFHLYWQIRAYKHENGKIYVIHDPKAMFFFSDLYVLSKRGKQLMNDKLLYDVDFLGKYYIKGEYSYFEPSKIWDKMLSERWSIPIQEWIKRFSIDIESKEFDAWYNRNWSSFL